MNYDSSSSYSFKYQGFKDMGLEKLEFEARVLVPLDELKIIK